MKAKTKTHDKPDRGFDAKTFWRHYVATVDTEHDWEEERPEQGRTSNRLFLFLLLFHIFLIGSVVLYNLVSERPKPVFVDNSLPSKVVNSSKQKPSPSPTGTATGASKQVETVQHRVEQGESLKSIADAAGCTQEEIATLNHFDVNMQLAVGSVLRVPKSNDKPGASAIPAGVQPARVAESVVAVQNTTAATTAKFFAPEPAPSPKKVETALEPMKPATVASKLPEEKAKPKVEDSPPPAPAPKVVAKVAEAPPAPKAKPTEVKAVERKESPAPAVTKTAELAKPAAAVAKPKTEAGTVSHTVKPRETFYSISRKYGVKVDELMRINGITDPGKLREGVVLKVPAK